jgi:hypothetical protein
MATAAAHPESSTDGATHDHSDRDAQQHGDTAGHLPASNSGNIDLVSSLALKNVVPEKIADVGVHKGYAYLAAWGVVTCKYNGVHVVDIRDPESPEEVAFIPSKEGSYPGEGVQALYIDTPSFQGDILVTNNEKCKVPAGFGGMNIYNVSNPAHPTPLAIGVGDFTVNGQGKKDSNQIHSVFAWDAGDKAYAVIVDNEEFPDVDIIDITDPKKAKLVAEHDLALMFPQILQPELTEVFHHDVIVKKIGNRFIMSVSYWDGGYVLLDVTDPLNPTYVADSDFPNPDSIFGVLPEGNGHQSEFNLNNQYLIGADEDFGPFAVNATSSDGSAIHASQGSNTTPLEPGDTITGTSRFVGQACIGDPVVPPAGVSGDEIAVVERGVCTFSEKVANVIAAGGYEAVLIFNRTDAASGGCEATLGMTVEGNIHTFGVAPRSEGFALFGADYSTDACNGGAGQALPVVIGTLGNSITFSSYFDGWGYVRLFENDLDPNDGSNKLFELDTYAVPEAQDPDFAFGFGDLSVHEVAASHERNDLLYFSYYSAGFRVVEIQNDQLVEVGHYIDEGGNNFWGVQVFEHDGDEYVAASDRDKGLYIFRYNQP